MTQREYDLTRASADYPTWSGMPLRSLIICAQQRSGSTLLSEALYFAGGLGCPLEYFHGPFRTALDARWKPVDLRAYLAALYRLRTDPTGTLSVKLFWPDLVALLSDYAPSEFRRLAESTTCHSIHSYTRMLATLIDILPNPTFVLLDRRDKVRQAVSQLAAAQTGVWRHYGRGAQGARKVAYDFHGIAGRLARIQQEQAHWLKFFQANGVPFTPVYYEDLARDYHGTMRMLLAALGRSDARVAPPRLRKQADSHSELLLQRFLADFSKRARG